MMTNMLVIMMTIKIMSIILKMILNEYDNEHGDAEELEMHSR